MEIIFKTEKRECCEEIIDKHTKIFDIMGFCTTTELNCKCGNYIKTDSDNKEIIFTKRN